MSASVNHLYTGIIVSASVNHLYTGIIVSASINHFTTLLDKGVRITDWTTERIAINENTSYIQLKALGNTFK